MINQYYHQQERTLYISDTGIVLRSFCRPEEISRYAFDSQFGTHAQYKSLYTKKESLIENAAQPDANVACALEENTIIGFGVLNHPDEGERWNDLGRGMMMEVKAIEVCRNRRSSGIAGNILEMLIAHPRAEEMIIYMVGYSWTWDLDGTGKSALAYRNMLIRLFEPFEFQELQTNEPNVSLKPENLFMGRIGQGLTDDIRNKFKWLRFGVSP